MIGKIIADASGLTEKWGGEKNGKYKEIKQIKLETRVEKTEWKKFKQEVKAAKGDTVKIKTAIDNSAFKDLKKVEELYNYAVSKSQSGQNVRFGKINNLIQTQNYKNIADQAHGYLGVKKAINEYNDSLIRNEDGTTKASKGTKKLNSAISQSNSSLGKYLTNLNGATAGMGKYALSLTTAAVKTFTLKTVTMGLNMAVSMGVSFVISGIITAITNYVNRIDDAIEASHKAKEAIDEINSTLKSQQDLIKESGQKYAELAQHVNQLNNTNLDLKEDEYENFLDLSNQIAEQFPGLIKGYDDNGNAILNLQGTINDINSTLDSYIEKAKEASQIKIVQTFKGEGDDEDYFKGAKYEVDKLNSKANEKKKTKENLQKFKEGTLQNDDTEDLFGNYSNGSDSRFKADYVRKYLEDSGLKKKLHDKSFLNDLSEYLSENEQRSFNDAVHEWDFDLNGELSDSAILTIDEVLSKYSKESGYNISDYIGQQIKSATDDYNQFAKDVETKNKEISQNAQAVLEQSVIWSDPDTTDQMKTTMTNALAQIDWSDAQFKDFDGEQAAHYIQTVFASSFKKLSKDDKITVDKFFDADPNKINITEYIDLYEKIKAIFEKQGINIPISIEDIQNVEDKFNKSLEQMSDNDKETVKKYLADNGIDSASELDVWNKRTEGITNATDAIKAYEKKAQEVSQISSKDSTLSFSEAWKAIGTSGDKEADKAALEAKEKLLELAEAGKLTEEAFSKSSIADNFLKDTKLSAEEATKKINELISSADQLSSMKTGISSISSILGEKEENQSSKKTRTKGIGADTLVGMPEDIKAQTKEYEHFVEVLGDGTSKMKDCKEAANKLATAYVNSNNFLSNLTDENKDYYKSVLDEMGVENAAEVVTAALNKQKVNAKIATFDLKNATKQEISTLGSYVKSLDDSSKALAYYTLQQQIANNNALDTSDSVKNLMKLAKQCGITGEAISLMTSLAADMKTVEYYTTGDGKNDRNAGNIVSSANSEVNGVKKRLNKIIKNGVKVGTSPKVTPKNSSSSKDKSKKDKSDKSKSKQQFDWISRALDRLSSKLDLVKAKYDNLFTGKKIKNSDSLLKQQNKNLDKQYKLLQKTEKYQKKAQKKYTNKANSIKLDASLKKAVRDGRINSKSMKKLIATYGEKKAEKIQKYQDWYDKAQEQKKNRVTTQTAKRENRIQKYQNIVDTTEERRSLAQAGKENATTAKAKNQYIEKEKEIIETSYEYQIRIARLKKDSLEADRLMVEKEKELRDLAIEQHQNLADEHQSVLDQYNAEKELATKASEKNGLIESEKAKTQELYAEKIAIAGLEGNISEQKQLQAELDKQLRDFTVEQHQNLADEYQAELDKSSAEKENLYTAGEKNAVVDREKNLTSQLYAEKIAIARIEGRISEEQQLQEELTRQMVVLEKEKFDNISHYYENLMRLENNAYTDLKNASEELETRGLIVSGKLYNSQIAINNSKKKMYEDELLSLNNQLHSIKEGTDEWYESMDAIQSCENGIAELTKDTLALAEASRKVSFTLSDKILSRFDLISSEYDLFVKFMSDHKLTTDETGNFTEEGTATLGAYYAQLLLAEKDTETFKQSLSDMYDKLQRGEEGYTDQKAWDEYYEHMEKSFQLEEKYYDIRQNMIGLMKEKYNTELDFLQDIINKRKELLQAEKDEYDYRNTIEEKTKNIGVLAKQLQALNGDDSEAARSRIQQLKVNLDEAQKDLQDTEYDKWLSDQQTMLDNLYNEYHDFIDDKLNDTDALFNEAVTYLKDINVGAEVSEVLKSYGETYGHTYTPYFENINTALGKEGDIVKAITNTSDLITEHFNKQAVTTQEAGDVIKLISEIGQVDYDGDGRKRLVAAEEAYNSLSQEAKTIVDTTSVNGLTTLQQKQAEWLGLSESRKQEEERVRQQQEAERVSQQKEEMKKKLDYYIADTYGRDGRTYACNLHNASPADIGIAEAINRHELRRVDGWNSPNQAAINEIVSRINSEGTGVNIPATADGLWMYMQNIGYSNGGIAETLQKVPGMNGDDGWVTVKKGEGIFTPEQTQQFIKLVSNVDTLNPAVDMVKNLSKRDYEPVPNRITNQSVGEVNIEMNLPNVTNYEEFRRRMQSDPKIEKMFKSMIWDKGDFSKYRISM